MDAITIRLLHLRYEQRLKQAQEKLEEYARKPPKHPIGPPLIGVPLEELRALTSLAQPKAEDSADDRTRLEVLRAGAAEASSKEPAILLEHFKFLLDRLAPAAAEAAARKAS